ncbi:Na(+)-H(+) antiporter [Halomicronema hongdechloris C2206]|uniref:Na(+)-H(+) antiporter n=1 Tax=Halomicronema hongdechloris C2206 TaxID=1641165 RepID=A0A1Z3HRF5_9CYAN|nr:Na(+)-H(+) antiporter [Halomicronema hongdechloris C2206]
MESLIRMLPESPIIGFTALLLVTLTIPPIFERLKLPGLVGLLLAGVLLGPSGLHLLNPDGEVEKLLSDIGKIYLMFVAGLEIDLQEFSKNRNRSLGFGAITFLLPLAAGTMVGRFFGYDWNGSILIGSLLSSHTLLGYPIVMRLGVAKEESVTITVGATIFTDIAALIVLAMCVAAQAGEFSVTTLIAQLLMLAGFAALVLFGLDWAGRHYFRRSGDEQGNQFLFVLLAVFLSAVGSQLINVDKIVGAFLAGLAVNDVVGDGPVKEKVEFVGSVLFIPFFFVCMGLLLDVPAFIDSVTSNLGFTAAIVTALLLSKLLASVLIKGVYGYSWVQAVTMWSLSLPQVAATLAAALVGLQTGLISSQVFNAVIVLMLVTALVGPSLTRFVASQLPRPRQPLTPVPTSEQGDPFRPTSETQGFTVVVPVANPLTERYLIEMAALLARHEAGRIIPLTIAQAHVHMDEPQLITALERGRGLLRKAEVISQEFGSRADPMIRVDDDVAEGISRTAREHNASLIVMGWSPVQGLRARLFGTLIDSVFWAAHCPVAVTQLLADPLDIHHILVPIKTVTPEAMQTLRFAQIFADTHDASITLLHVCDRRLPKPQIEKFEIQLYGAIQDGPEVPRRVKIVRHESAAKVILAAARQSDLVILRSTRRRTAGGLAVSDVTHEVLAGITCSVVLFGEPHS